MPVYAYRCHSCRHVFEVRHGMFFESQRCVKCRSDDVQKIPTEIFVETNKEKNKAIKKETGKLADEFIKEVKKEVKEEKEKLKKQEIK